jgi:hypothetical protein
MATKRRKILPRRIGRPVPPWAERLLAGEQPDRRDPEVESGTFAWLIGEVIPGLPDYDTLEAARLIERAGGWPEPARLKG